MSNVNRSPRALFRLAGVVGAAIALLAARPAAAQAPTQTCVEVVSDAVDAAGLRALVESELDRHPTHRAVQTACESFLRVELIEVDGQRFLTARINTQVPHREVVTDLEAAVGAMLTVVLNNDPIRLRGPQDRGWVRRQLHALRSGVTYFGVEAYQIGAWVHGDLRSLPGVALQARREVDQWHLGVRLALAWRLSDYGDALTLTGHVAGQLQVAWFWSDTADTSAYFGALMGLEHQRFSGPSSFDDGVDRIAKTGFAAGGRIGVEMFRTTTGRLDLFGQVMLPVGSTTDAENGVVDAYVPTVSLGAGMVF